MKWFDGQNPAYPVGAELSRHPFFDTQAFYGVSRRSFPFAPADATPIRSFSPETYCAFCEGRLADATPDKARTLFSEGLPLRVAYPKLQPSKDTLFRRQGNLFEIISFDYWCNKYGVQSTAKELTALEEFFSEPETAEYLLSLLRYKFSRMEKPFDSLSSGQQREAAQPFFSGFHELLTSGRHFQKGASTKDGLFTSGSMGWQEHRISYEDLIFIHEDMLQTNPHIKYISTFQNWLGLAGASFEHWHKQILAADFWGKPLLRERIHFQSDPEAYARFALDTAIENDFIFAENEYALAYLEVGAKTGLAVVASKSQNLQPHRHRPEEIHGMSDMVHALCGALGNSTPYNEEWFYTPFDAEGFKTPWRVVINLRSGIEAGFENINQYLVSTVSQRELAQHLRERLTLFTPGAPGIASAHASPSHKNILRYLG